MLLFKTFSRLTCLTLCSQLVIGCAASTHASTANIAAPGPDFANYPNSAYTLPQGRAYVEAAPFTYYGKAAGSPRQYNAGYLLRYGLTDAIELRLLSSGITMQDGNDKKRLGISPPIFDIKWHVMDADAGSWFPAIGVEASVQSNWASAEFKNGTQPALSLNFDQTLPYEIGVEYNIGFIGVQDQAGNDIYQFDVAWAIQRNIAEPVAVFVNGYINTAAGLTTSAIGGGAQWTLNDRIAVFTNINAGLTVTTPSLSGLLGFAVAF